MKKIVSAVFFAGLSFMMVPTSKATPAVEDGQQGCCSHHGGVCGCSNHHTTCCDGATSPSCQCRAE